MLLVRPIHHYSDRSVRSNHGWPWGLGKGIVRARYRYDHARRARSPARARLDLIACVRACSLPPLAVLPYACFPGPGLQRACHAHAHAHAMRGRLPAKKDNLNISH